MEEHDGFQEAVGDPAVAVEALFHAEWGRLVGLARLLVDERGDAEEVVQEAFVRLLAAWPTIRDSRRAPAWLRSTVVNAARGRLRHRLVAQRHPSAQRLVAAGADEPVLAAAEHDRVIGALRRLSRRQRECVVLRHWEELSEAEIAAALGISTGSVKTHVHRAMAVLSSSLEVENG